MVFVEAPAKVCCKFDLLQLSWEALIDVQCKFYLVAIYCMHVCNCIYTYLYIYIHTNICIDVEYTTYPIIHARYAVIQDHFMYSFQAVKSASVTRGCHFTRVSEAILRFHPSSDPM